MQLDKEETMGEIMSILAKLDREPRIVVVIISYNSETYARSLVRSIAFQKYDKEKVLVIVIDNASVDNSVQIFHRALKGSGLNYMIVKLNKNLGFAPANNLALRLVKKLYDNFKNKIIIFLNPDTKILDSNMFNIIDSLVEKAGILGIATISNNHNIIDSLGSYIDPLGNPLDILCCARRSTAIEGIIEKLPLIYKVPAVCFAAVAIRGDIIDRIGLLRTDYVIYFEDTEYSLRAWSRGIPVFMLKRFMVWHARGGTQRTLYKTYNSIKKLKKLDITFHSAKNIMLLTYEYLGIVRFLVRVILYFVEGFARREKAIILASIYVLKKIIKNRNYIEHKKLSKDIMPRLRLTETLLFWALKYKLRYPYRSITEAIKYGSIKVSIFALRRIIKEQRVKRMG